MTRPSATRALPWLGLAAIAAIYLVAMVRLHPANFFGITQDDTIYFSSARALAQGRGYILPSLPGTPPATKYPILYPWILSWVWRFNPSFPGNLRAAIGISAGFALAYIALTFVFLKHMKGIGHAEALLLTAFCALQPTVLFYGSTVNSDIAFAAVSLAALLLAERATEPAAGFAGAAGCGTLSGLAIVLRILGVPVAAGILAASLLRRAWKQAAILAACIAPFVAWTAWQTIQSAKDTMPPAFSSAGPGFRQTWIFYTSYLGFRKLSMIDAHLVFGLLFDQITYLLVQAPGYFISPLFNRQVVLLLVGTVIMLWMLFAGVARGVRQTGWRPAHLAFVFTVALILAWDYPEDQRFLMAFLPLLAGSVWIVGKSWAGQIGATLAKPRSKSDQLLAAGCALALSIFFLGIAWNFVANKDRASLRTNSTNRGALLADKREAYDWLRSHAPEDARVAAGQDALLYLYTGRQAMSHIALRRAGANDPAYMMEDLVHLTDVATAIGASYWMSAPDDSSTQWVAAKPFLAERYRQVQSGLPELFHSRDGQARIYGFGCLGNVESAHCPGGVAAAGLDASR